MMGILLVALFFIQSVLSQFPQLPNYTAILQSPIDASIKVQYRTPEPGTCATFFPFQKQYSGYITIPPNKLTPIRQAYTVNTFFWFFESRSNPEAAPLTIYLNGGPGTSSMVGLFQETGPCEVVRLSDGTYGTKPRTWGWDRGSNILFVDQPGQVGLSFDSLNHRSYDFLNPRNINQPSPVPKGVPPYTYVNGTFSSDDTTFMSNTTQIAAEAVWHFLQAFLATFPQYNPGSHPSGSTANRTGVHLFAESYGGIYAPAFAETFEEKNQQRLDGSLAYNETLEICLESVGIINGIVDMDIQTPYYPKFLHSNTYGIQALSEADMLDALDKYNTSCGPEIQACRSSAWMKDPEDNGDDTDTNYKCYDAQSSCNDIVNIVLPTNRSAYDIRQMAPSPFPPLAYQEYLNTAAIQSAIGTAINYTESNSWVQQVFISTGDQVRSSQLQDLASLLARGIRVALIYGDADYIANWMGGEAVSLALARQKWPNSPGAQYPANVQSPYVTSFPSAGYANLMVNSSHVGGAIRQFGNLSFTRVYDSGHLVPAYQPETAFTLFTRIIKGLDVSTGQSADLSNCSTTGPATSTHMNTRTYESEPSVCWIRDIQDTCTSDQMSAIQEGQGNVYAGVWYPEAEYQPPTPGGPASGSTGTNTTGGT